MFTTFLHAGRGTIDMKHIKWAFSLKACIRSPLPSLVDKGDGAEDKIQLVSENGHVAYHIKGFGTCSNMAANILPVDTPLTSWMGSKRQHIFFLKVVVLHVKLKGIEHRAPCKDIFCDYTHPRAPGVWSKGQNICFKRSHVAYQIKGN